MAGNSQPDYGTLSVFDLRHDPLNWPDYPPAEITFHELSFEEAAQLQSLMEATGEYEPGDALKRLKRGKLAFAVKTSPGEGEVYAAFGWVSLDIEPLGNSGYSFKPPPGDAWLYDFATLPVYRGREFYPTLLRFILLNLAGRHLTRAWIGTAPGNDTSARSISRAGFTLIARTGVTYSPGNPPFTFINFPAPGVSLELLKLAETTLITRKK